MLVGSKLVMSLEGIRVFKSDVTQGSQCMEVHAVYLMEPYGRYVSDFQLLISSNNYLFFVP